MKSESIKELAGALAKAQQEMQNPEKNKSVEIITKTGRKINFDYADLGALKAASKEPMANNGLSIVHTLEQVADKTVLETKLLHSSGEFISSTFPLSSDPDIKTFAGEITYAKRYNKAALLDMFADDDNDSGEGAGVDKKIKTDPPGGNTFIENNKPCTPAQAKLIQVRLDIAKLNGLHAEKLLNKYGSHLPERIPFSKVNDVLADIEAYAKKKHPSEPPDVTDDFNVDRIFKK